MLQVLPAVVVAVFVLILGSAAVVAQLAAAQWGTRAPLMLTMSDQFQHAVVQPVFLLIAVLLLAGQVPDPPTSPDDLVVAVVGALTLATVVLTVRAITLPVFVIRVVSPASFPAFVVEDVWRELEGESTGLVVFRTGLLGEMLRHSLRREDSVAVGGTLTAILELQAIYLSVLERVPAIGNHVLDGGIVREHWLAEDLCKELVAAAEQSLRDLAPAEDVNAQSHVLGTLARRFIEAGEEHDAWLIIKGLIGLGTSAHQITAEGVINWHGPPAEILASLEAIAEQQEMSSLATYALAGWALVSAYPTYHFNQRRHPMWVRCINDLGEHPPWEPAQELLGAAEWVEIWGNKQYKGPGVVRKTLRDAKAGHARRPLEG